MKLQELIDKLGLEPLQGEGGMFCRTYACADEINGRTIGTAIYYLLDEDTFSHLHLLDADEIYHFYLGDPVELYQLTADGEMTMTILGHDLAAGESVQTLVPKGVWQGSRLAAGGKWALLGTTMSPGYEQSGYTHANREELIKLFPKYDEVIKLITYRFPLS